MRKQNLILLNPALCEYVRSYTHGEVIILHLCSERVVENPSDKQSSLLRNYCEHIHNKFNKYAACFFFCELLNVTISVSQVSSPGPAELI